MNAEPSDTGLDERPFRRSLWQGLLFWTLVAIIGIALRGVRWEEGLERAQAMLGVVPYPADHPLPLYAWNAFSVHYYSSALLLWLSDSPLLVCGLRNLLCAWGALVPVYLMASVFARSTAAGHLAAGDSWQRPCFPPQLLREQHVAHDVHLR